uniref:Ig-like domain-containing protein n=1 Tax=Pundamilia nyererei TaxID=303518 RepID=A0A3B4FYF4_9CICH
MVWITLSFLHRGCKWFFIILYNNFLNFYREFKHSLVPVKTVQLGEAATLTCALPIKEFGSITVHWYKQSAGDGLKLIVTLSKSAPPEYSPEFSRKRFNVENANNVCNLTVLKTVQEDEGIYHCGIAEWMYPIQWSETYLSNNLFQCDRNMLLHKIAPPGGSVTLHCSLLSNFDNKTCSGGLSMFWFREGSNPSHPSIIYTDGNRHHECGDSSTEKSCAYRFSKNVSSSDAGTYYCAVATCGEILYGKGTKLDIQGTSFSISFSFCLLNGTNTEFVDQYIYKIIRECKITPFSQLFWVFFVKTY